MKKYLPALVGIVALLLSAVFVVRSCKIDDKYSVLKGENNILKEQVAVVEKAAVAEREAAQKRDAEKDKVIAASKQTEADLRAKIGKKDAALNELDKDLAAAKTDAERVPILTSMVETWAAKYADLEGVVTEKGKQLAAWAGKYASAVTIGESWKAQYEAERRLRLSGETLNKMLEGKFRRAKLTSAVKDVALVALVGATTYQFLKGK